MTPQESGSLLNTLPGSLSLGAQSTTYERDIPTRFSTSNYFHSSNLPGPVTIGIKKIDFG